MKFTRFPLGCGFRNIKCFTAKGYWPFAQPPIWRAWCCNSSNLSPGTCPARLNLPGTAVPAGIASRVTKARKPPHHDKVQHLGRPYAQQSAKRMGEVRFPLGKRIEACRLVFVWGCSSHYVIAC